MKYVVYYRVSTKRQGDSGLGLESQKAYIEHYLSDSDVVAEFTDVKSGKSVEGRKELQKAIELCKSKGYTLAVAKIDRLSRRTEDALNIYSALDGRLFSCDIPNLDKFTLTLFMAIADRERELISLRTKQALQAKKERGETWNRNGAKNLTDEVRAKAVQAIKAKAANNKNNQRAMRLVCSLRNNGMSYGKIATELNNNGFKTSRGKTFSAIQVQRLYNRFCL